MNKNRHFPVEYDRYYAGGNYQATGQFVYLPVNELDTSLEEPENVHKLFQEKTGIDPIHIVHYNLGEACDSEGNLLD